MTRKDYIPFARMFFDNKPDAPSHEYALWCRLVQNTADIFEADNPRFDRDRFLRACGLYDTEA